MVMYDIALGDDVLFFDFTLFIADDNIRHTGLSLSKRIQSCVYLCRRCFSQIDPTSFKIMDTLHCKSYGGRHIKSILWQQNNTEETCFLESLFDFRINKKHKLCFNSFPA